MNIESLKPKMGSGSRKDAGIVQQVKPGTADQIANQNLTGCAQLHVRTGFSFYQSTCRVLDLVRQARKLNITALAIADTNTLFGAVKFFRAATKEGIKPIIGCELNVAGATSTKASVDTNPHLPLVLLAQNREGYANLVRLVSELKPHGSSTPSVPKAMLAQHHRSLIALSGGGIARLLLDNRFQEAQETAEYYLQLFGADRFYLELQRHGSPDETATNQHLIALARQLGIQLAATTSVRYIHPGDRRAYECLKALGEKDSKRKNSTGQDPVGALHLRSAKEMRTLYADVPEALDCALEIASRCNFALEVGSRQPLAVTPKNGRSPDDLLRDLLVQGLQKRYGISAEHYRAGPEGGKRGHAMQKAMSPAVASRHLAATDASGKATQTNQAIVLQRLEHELRLIEQEGITEVFLVARWLADYAAGHGTSCFASYTANSLLISYLLGVTHVDPIACGLIPEMFLDVRKGHWPGIVFEFPKELVPGLVSKMREDFGERSLARIASFRQLTTPYLLRALGPEFGVSVKCVQSLVKRLPEWGRIDDDVICQKVPEIEITPSVRDLLSAVICLQALPCQRCELLATFVLSNDLVAGGIPLACSDDGEMVTHYDCCDLAALGHFTFSTLGWSHLSLVAQVIKAVQTTRGLVIDPNLAPLDDPATYSLLGRGDLAGFREFKGQTMAQMQSELKPCCFEDVIAAVNLWENPWNISSEKYLPRHQGRSRARYLHPFLKDITRITHGFLVYTEQVLHSWMLMSGGSVHEALVWIHAVSHEQNQEQETMREDFVARCQRRHGISPAECNRVYRGLRRAARKSDGKANLASQARVVLQVAYLKAHYAKEFNEVHRVIFRKSP